MKYGLGTRDYFSEHVGKSRLPWFVRLCTISGIRQEGYSPIWTLHVWWLGLETSSKCAFSLSLVLHWDKPLRILFPKTHNTRCPIVPIILGSDKTTVSVATGHIEYWPLYASIGKFIIIWGVRMGLVCTSWLSIHPKKFVMSFHQPHPLYLLTLCHQPIRPIQMMLTSASFDGSFFTSHFHIFCNHFGMARSLLKSFDVLMGISGASYGE